MVSLATPGATMRYTLDGSEPTDEDPVVTSGGSIPIAAGRLWVQAVRPGWEAGNTVGDCSSGLARHHSTVSGLLGGAAKQP